ncbi:MAG TPA: TAXI family TRAP transporter solute-binding subunit [Reyranella sp.]|nr:TAXI family TRAP transporter solute-binding subunit [Reyranella sp.]
MIRRRTLLLSAPAVSLAPVSGRAQSMAVRLGTSTEGGGFAAYSVALIDALKSVDPILDIRTVETKGATENAERLQSGDIDIGLVSGEVMYNWIAEHPDAPKLRVVSVIYSAPGMFAVRPDTRFRRIRDLLGRPVVWNPRGTGSAVQARYVLDGIGLDIDRDFEAIYPERFTDGPPMVMERRAAALWGSGYRWPGFVELANQPGGVRFVVPTAEEIAQIRAKHPFLAQLTVPPGLYPGQYDPIVTVGAWSFILARPDLDDAVGHRLARSLYKTERTYAPTKHIVQTTIRNTLLAIRSPDELQPGVLRFYREAKLIQ